MFDSFESVKEPTSLKCPLKTSTVPAWKLAAKDVLKYDEKGNLISVNLDIKNPKAKQDLEHLPPDQVVDGILKKEQRIMELMGDIKQALAQQDK